MLLDTATTYIAVQYNIGAQCGAKEASARV